MSLLRNRTLLAATLGHFSVDMYSGMLPLILLVLTDRLGLSYSQIGLASMMYSLTSSLCQPFFGWLGDRRGRRPIAVVAVAAVATTVGVMRFVDQYAILVGLGLIAGLGSGAFHPQGATLAARQLDYADKAKTSSSPTSLSVALSAVITLTLVIFLRSWIHSSVSTYVPQVYRVQGFSTEFASNVLFSILLPLAIGGLIGGTLSDKIGRRRVLIVSTGLSSPALWGLMHTAGPASFILGPVLGLAIGASLPVTLVMAQSLIPRGMGLVSGIVLGFTFIAGAIGVAINGVIADQVGLLPTMTFNALLPLAAAALAFFLPDDRPR